MTNLRSIRDNGITMGEVSAPFRLVIGDRIGPAECPYMRRFFVQTPLGTVRIHKFLRSDDDRALHDHPWSFVTVILRGGYRDISEAGVDTLRPGSVRYRPALHAHRVELDPGASAWTLVLSGPKRRTWGFWEGRTFVPWRKFVHVNGAPACSDEAPDAGEPLARFWPKGRSA